MPSRPQKRFYISVIHNNKPETHIENANNDAHSTESACELFITFHHLSCHLVVFAHLGLWDSVIFGETRTLFVVEWVV